VTLNNHAFFVIFDTSEHRQMFLSQLRERQVSAYIGYVPLHSFTKGLQMGYKPDDLPITEDLANRVVRLPLYTDLANEGLGYALDSMRNVLKGLYGS